MRLVKVACCGSVTVCRGDPFIRQFAVQDNMVRPTSNPEAVVGSRKGFCTSPLTALRVSLLILLKGGAPLPTRSHSLAGAQTSSRLRHFQNVAVSDILFSLSGTSCQ